MISVNLGIGLEEAAKKCRKKFACGSNVVDNDQIEIQGDVAEEVIEYLCKEYKDVIFTNQIA
jgi:translation initiation factor 1 (eIF-1/SUI1)